MRSLVEAWATCRHRGDVAKVKCTLLERQKDCRDPDYLMHALFEANQTLHYESVKLFTVHRAPPLDPWRGVQDVDVRREDPSSWLIAVSPEKSQKVYESFAREHAYVANENTRFTLDNVVCR